MIKKLTTRLLIALALVLLVSFWGWGGIAQRRIVFSIPRPTPAPRSPIWVENPYRDDNLLAPGSIAALRGTQFVERHVSVDPVEPLPFELGGLMAELDGHACGIWIASPEVVHIRLPRDIQVRSSREPHRLRVSTVFGLYETEVWLAPAAPGLIYSLGSQAPGGAWRVGLEWPWTLHVAPVLVRPGSVTRVLVYGTGMRRFVRKSRDTGGVWAHVGSFRVLANVEDFGIPGHDAVYFDLPSGIETGSYVIMIEADGYMTDRHYAIQVRRLPLD